MPTLFGKKHENISFDDALREVRLSKPGRPRRAKSTVTDGGLLRLTVYLSPNELESLDALAADNGVNRSQFIRTMIRQLRPTEIDSDGSE